MDEFTEFGNGFDQMGRYQFADPSRWFLTQLSLEFDFKDCVGEATDVGFCKLVERVVYSDIRTTPVVSCARTTIKVVFANQRKFCVKRNPHSSVSRSEERR